MMVPNTPPVTLDFSGHVATLKLNRPPRNTMTPELMGAFVDALERIRRHPETRAAVITSEGRHFGAGAELTAGLPGETQALAGLPGTADRLRQVYAPFLALVDLPIPTVAAIDGAAVGGGLGLALSCDLRVVSPRTRFLAPFVRLGIHPGMGLTHLLPMLIGLPRATEMLLLGEELRGEEAVSWGLANRCVPPEEVQDTARDLAERLAAGAPAVVRWTKKAMRSAIAFDPHPAADREAFAQALTFASEDSKEGILAFLEKRAPRFTGS